MDLKSSIICGERASAATVGLHNHSDEFTLLVEYHHTTNDKVYNNDKMELCWKCILQLAFTFSNKNYVVSVSKGK